MHLRSIGHWMVVGIALTVLGAAVYLGGSLAVSDETESAGQLTWNGHVPVSVHVCDELSRAERPARADEQSQADGICGVCGKSARRIRSASGGTVAIDVTTIDFGQQPPDSFVEGSFTIFNESDNEAIVVKDIITSCGCLKFDVPRDQQIEPGGMFRVSLTLELPHRPGKEVRQPVYIWIGGYEAPLEVCVRAVSVRPEDN